MAIKPGAMLSDEQRNAFTVAYRLYERFHAMDGTPEDWLAFVEEYGRAGEELGDSILARFLLMAVLDTLETTQKEREREERENPAPEQTVMTDADGKPVVW